MRLFIGIPVPEQLSTIITNQTQLNTLKGHWQHPLDYHITLVFLGEYPEENLAQLHALLDHTTFQSFNLTANSIGCFENTQTKRIFWVGIEPSQPVQNLRNTILDQAPKHQLELNSDEPFLPHITILRTTGNIPNQPLATFNQQPFSFTWRVKRFCLFQRRTLIEENQPYYKAIKDIFANSD